MKMLKKLKPGDRVAVLSPSFAAPGMFPAVFTSIGVTWGGCLESIDELLRHGIEIPSLEECENVVLCTETCEEISPSFYVSRVSRALGERGILERVRAVVQE